MSPQKLFLALLLSLAPWVVQADLVTGARAQVGITLSYDPAYVSLSYPNGDVPKETGVCTDVIIRAMRSCGLDLQQAVHEDMKKNFSRYPKNWGLKRPDRNIDHRRVPNLECYFKRQGWALPLSQKAGDYQAGDIVCCILPPHLPHIMIVSDRKAPDGTPLVIHNVGRGAQEENFLLAYPITAHFRPQWSNEKVPK